MRVTGADQPGELTVARAFVEVGNVVDNVPQDSRGTIEDVTLPPEFFATAKFKPETIGYDKLVLDVAWDGTRDLAAKTMTIRDFTVAMIWGVVIVPVPRPADVEDRAGPEDYRIHRR